MRDLVLKVIRLHWKSSVSIDDVAFVGVPGEMTNELGLKIKWHSPYSRTFIAYCATDYSGYISTANQVAAGGY